MIGRTDLVEQVNLIKDTAESIIISNEDELKTATDFIKEIKEKQKVVKDFYEPMVKATKESYDKVKAERDNLLKPLQETEKEMRTLMNDYNNKLLQLKRAEEERLRREKEAQQKKLLEAQQNIINGDTEKAQEQMQEIMNNTTINEKTIEIPKVAGMSTITKYINEITDI